MPHSLRGLDNYSITNAGAEFTIAKANATMAVSGSTWTYDGIPHGANGTATGVNAENLSALLTFGASFTNVPGGVASWTFAGDTNYNGAAGSATITINKAAATVTLGGLSQTFTGSPLAPTATTSPAGLTITLTGAPQTTAGSSRSRRR